MCVRSQILLEFLILPPALNKISHKISNQRNIPLDTSVYKCRNSENVDLLVNSCYFSYLYNSSHDQTILSIFIIHVVRFDGYFMFN